MKPVEKAKKQHSPKRIFLVTAAIMSVLIVVGILLSSVRIWADFYTDHIYTLLRDPVSRLTEMIPFPLGEVMMYLGAILIVLTLLLLILLIFLRKKKTYWREYVRS